MKNLSRHIKLFIVVFSIIYSSVEAQPVFQEKIIIDDVVLYKDFKDTSIYYYQPKSIFLHKKQTGEPSIKYLRMVESSVVAQSNFNVIQLKFNAKDLSKSKLYKIKMQLGNGVMLKPLLITKTEFYLIPSSESVARQKPIADYLNASYEGSKENVEWKNKTVTLSLSKEATQVINDNLSRSGSLGIHFSYAFYSDFVDEAFPEPYESSNVDSLRTELISFKSGIVDLSFDLEKWKDVCIKDIILNEAILPRYHPIAIQNFDFIRDSRPELLATRIIVCGKGLNNKKVCNKELEFSKEAPSAYTLKFKFPILFTQPLEYKIKEITKKGKVVEKEWVSVSLGQTIDITSQDDEIKYQNVLIDIETRIQEMVDAGYKSVSLTMNYSLNNKKQTKKIVFRKDDTNDLINTTIFLDKSSSLKYSVKWKKNDDSIVEGDNKNDLLTRKYIYLAPVKS